MSPSRAGGAPDSAGALLPHGGPWALPSCGGPGRFCRAARGPARVWERAAQVGTLDRCLLLVSSVRAGRPWSAAEAAGRGPRGSMLPAHSRRGGGGQPGWVVGGAAMSVCVSELHL